MLGEIQKMVALSSTTNQWPQNNIDENGLKASTLRNMEKTTQDQQQHQQQLPPPPHLKCPRCDSSNTKFCYYNNYSLSQPRHFCKACKRYWTRGGTLRNVPVGGGCRKNKRVKRSSIETTASKNPSVVSDHVDLSSTSSHINPLFYGLPTNHSEMNLQYPRVNPRDHVSGFDLQPRVNDLGLGFSSVILGSDGFNSNKQIHDPIYSSSYPLLGSSTSNSSSSLASLIASSFQHQKFMQEGNNFQGLLPFENLNMSNVEGGIMMKDMKMEGGHHWNGNNQIQMQQMNSSSDPSLWNTNGSWLDPSVPSLI